jgi:hypothetical protein
VIAKNGKERLTDAARFIKAGMANSDTGPLIIAEKVVSICDTWTDYKEESDGLSFRQWLTRELGNQGRNYGFFKRRLRAIENPNLGESIRRTFHHEVAVYVSEQVPEDMQRAVKDELEKRCIQNNRCPLTPGQAMPIIKSMLGHEPKRRECKRCKELEAKIAELETRGN